MNESARDRMIALSLLPFLTPSRTRLLLEYFDPLERVSAASAEALAALLHVSLDEARQIRSVRLPEELAGLRASVVTLCDEDYPPRLREIIDPPLVLHLCGERSLLGSPAIAIVGSRKATPYGINAARRLATELAKAGVTVVSGLARGIDAAAHDAALESGGRTIAVVGTGIDVVYPRAHRQLFDTISQRGLIVSEFAPLTPPWPANFPIRNRVIAGLSLGTVIVEATGKSGSLITARMAAEQGREVFAVPGSIFSPNTEGTHRLIQYGAKLVMDAGDIFDELPSLRPASRSPSRARHVPGIDPALEALLEAIPFDNALHIDQLAAQMETSVAQVAEPLLLLEMEGLIRPLGGGRYVRVARG